MPIRFLCPACKVSIKAKDDRGGQTVRCPACVVPIPQGELIQPPPPPMEPFTFDAPPEEVADPFAFHDLPPRSRRDDEDDYYRNRAYARHNAGGRAIAWGVMAAILMAGVGLASSQYFPVFGSLLERNIAEPWSPARMGLIPLHLLVFASEGLSSADCAAT